MPDFTHSEKEKLVKFAQEMSSLQRETLRKLREGEIHVNELRRHLDLDGNIRFDELLEELNAVHALEYRQGRSNDAGDFTICLQSIFWHAKICPHCNKYIF